MKKNRKYIQGDYYSAQKSCKSYLETLSDASQRMGRKLTKFNGDSDGKLVGREFDILRGRLNMYASAFSSYASMVDILSNNIVSSNNAVCNAMGGHSEVTDEYIDEIEAKINECQSLVYSANNKLQSLDDAAKEKQKRLLSQYNSNLAALREEKRIMEELIDAVEAADNSGVSSVDTVTVKMNNLKAKMMY